MLERMPQYEFLGRRCAGGRVRFETDSPRILIRMTLDACREDINIPLSGSAGADIYLGSGRSSAYLGYIAPKVHTDQEIGVEEQAVFREAPEYRTAKPVVFYGSSITEGGCAGRAGTSYTSVLGRWLDADVRNFGFSGKAKGETEFAEYIAGLSEMSLFVYDYDHNAPDADKNPADAEARREAVRRTYENARTAGDENVWFLDGGTFFGNEGRQECTVDGTHPNSLRFMRMAQSLYPLLERILYGEVR